MSDREKNVGFAALLNVSFTVLEIIGGILTNSLALWADALHDFGDSIALTVSWFAEKRAKQPADKRRTFGYQRLSLFSSIFAAIVLISGSLFILSQAIPRLITPEHVNAEGMIFIAIIGLVINGLGFLKLKKGISQNEKILSWHLLEDFLGWIVLIIGAVMIKFWDYHIIDPILTIGFTAFVLWGVSKNVKETFNIMLQGVPKHIDIDKVKKSILSVKGVKGVHDIHVWSLEGETDILTAHVIAEDTLLKNSDKIRKSIKAKLKKHHIEHSTIEIENKRFCSGKECYFESNDRLR